MAKKQVAHKRTRPQSDTIRERYESQDRFVQDWDKLPGEEQRISRLKNRLEMGQKMTLPGPKGGTGTRPGC